jgi:hypothetical protein
MSVAQADNCCWCSTTRLPRGAGMAQSGMAAKQGMDWRGVTTKSIPIPWSDGSRDDGAAGVRPYNVNVFDARQCMASISNPVVCQLLATNTLSDRAGAVLCSCSYTHTTATLGCNRFDRITTAQLAVVEDCAWSGGGPIWSVPPPPGEKKLGALVVAAVVPPPPPLLKDFLGDAMPWRCGGTAMTADDDDTPSASAKA